jgi:chain length determinant protein EpsF
MTFNQFLRIVRARWILACAILAISVFGTLIVSLVMPKSYTATATVMADIRPDPVSVLNTPGALAATYLATQVDLIKSPNVSQRVVRTLRLTDNEELRQRWVKATNQQGDYTAWLADLISQGLEVKPSRESSVIQINYDGASPAFAAALANAYAKAYIESTVQIRIDPARQYTDFFEERTRLAREKLEKARTRLAEAQRAKGIVVTDERLDVENARLAELSTQVTALRSLKAETLSRSSQSGSYPDQMRDVLNNPVVASLKADLARQESRLNEMSERYGDAHPSVLETRANVAALRERIQNETRRVTGSVRVDNNMAQSRLAEAEAQFEAQRQRVLKLKDARAELQVLEREVDTAQRVYDSIQERLNQTSLESNVSQSGIYLLSAATEPTKPTSPRLLLNVIVSIVLGALLALMSAIGVELFDRRVRGPLDIVQALDVSVIGLLPAPKAKLARKRTLQIGSASNSQPAVVTVPAQQ